MAFTAVSSFDWNELGSGMEFAEPECSYLIHTFAVGIEHSHAHDRAAVEVVEDAMKRSKCVHHLLLGFFDRKPSWGSADFILLLP